MRGETKHDIEFLEVLWRNEDEDLNDLFKQWTTATKTAAELSLPAAKESRTLERRVSERTKNLFAKRTNMNPKSHTKEDYARIQRQIKDSSLRDFKDWVTCS